MKRIVSRLIEKEFIEGNPKCLVPPCKNIAFQWKDGKYRNYCKDHSYYDMFGYTTWKGVRERIIERDKKCMKCGDDRKVTITKEWKLNWRGEEKEVEVYHNNFEVDHIEEVATGGDLWDEDNLQLLCKKCHRVKTSIFMKKPRASRYTKRLNI